MKSKILALAVVGSVIASGSALAMENKFYLGAEVNYNNPSYKTLTTSTTGSSFIKKNKAGFSFEGGARLHENFGLGLGYNFFKKSKQLNDSSNEVAAKLKNLYLDAFGYYPVSEQVNLVGSLGLGKLKPSISVASETITAPTDVNKGKFKLRAGIGAEYKFDDNVYSRVMFRYQKGNNVIKSNSQAGLAVFYVF